MTSRREQRIALPAPAPGTQRTLTVVHYGEPQARPFVYMQAALHADELPGTVVLHHLDRLLCDVDARGGIVGRIAIVPVANPIGMAQSVQGQLAGRIDLDGGKNFNRHYPDLRQPVLDRIADRLGGDAEANTGLVRDALAEAVNALSSDNEGERLRHLLLGLAVGADVCLDLHCDSEALLHLFTGTPLWPRAASLAARLGAEGVFLATESGGQPFDEAVGGPWWAVARAYPDHPVEPACLSATIELRGISDVDDAVALADARSLYAFLADEGAIDDPPERSPAPRCEPTPLDGVHYVRAPCAGVVLYTAALGDWVRENDVVATVLDPMHHGADARRELRAATDGRVFARSAQRFARPGAVVMSIAGREPLARPSGVGLLTD